MLLQHWRKEWFGLPPLWKGLLVLLLVAGIGFRFVDLGQKPYWRDEAVTLMRISGHTWAETIQEVYDGRPRKVEEIQQYQHPGAEKGIADIVRSLTVEDAQHPPLYYLLARFWVQLFGTGESAVRALSGVISLLTLPCMYWLCLELFQAPSVGWVAIALTSVSIFHITYAHEAREYSLWILTIVVTSIALLRAMRLPDRPWFHWSLYALSLTLALYTFPLTGLVLLGYGVYVWMVERLRPTQTAIAASLASVAALVAYAPWLLAMYHNLTTIQGTTGWAEGQVPLSFLWDAWVRNLSYTFLSARPRILYSVVAAIAYALIFLYRRAASHAWLFVVTLIGSSTMPLLLPDLLDGGRRSATNRYLIPCYLGIQLAMAFFIATQGDRAATPNRWQRGMGQILLAALLLAGLWTGDRYLRAEIGWLKSDSEQVYIAKIVNPATNPLVVYEAHGTRNQQFSTVGKMLALTHLLEPDVSLQLFVEPNLPDIPTQQFQDVFLIAPSIRLQETLKQRNYSLEKLESYAEDRNSLWRLRTNR